MASWGYETLLGVADFAAATLAGWGNIGTTLTILATERGTERFLQVLDQGGTMEQAFWSGVTTGALDRILNKLPVEKLLGKSSGKVRQTLWKTMKEQGLLQMGSEAAGRVTDIVADTVVMGEQSEYKRLEAQYLKQGLNGKEARRQALLDLAGSVAVSGGSGLVQGAALGSVAQLARRLFQMGNSGAEIEQEQPVQYIDPEQGSLDDNVRDLYAYYREQAQIDSAAKDGIMEAKLEDISQLSLNLNDTDFYVAPNGKILSKKYKEWIGPNKRDDLINSVKDETLKKIIGEVYRPGSVIGDGGTGDVIRFEKQTNILLSKSGHIQKGIDMIKYFQKLLDSNKLSDSDRKIAEQILNDLKDAMGGI